MATATKSTSLNSFESDAPLYPPSLQFGSYLSEEEGSQIPSHLSIGLDKILSKNKTLTFKHPRIFRASFDATEELYIIEDKSLEIHIFASSIQELKDTLREEIIFLWETYGTHKISENTLTQGAIKLRRSLRSQITEG